jgi:hypothetical protein
VSHWHRSSVLSSWKANLLRSSVSVRQRVLVRKPYRRQIYETYPSE